LDAGVDGDGWAGEDSWVDVVGDVTAALSAATPLVPGAVAAQEVTTTNTGRTAKTQRHRI
jgi:hypothetical protein